MATDNQNRCSAIDNQKEFLITYTPANISTTDDVVHALLMPIVGTKRQLLPRVLGKKTKRNQEMHSRRGNNIHA
jgi:hypothetical protein